MSNGIGGFIDDVLKKAMDAYADATKWQNLEYEQSKATVQRLLPGIEYGMEVETDKDIAEALEHYRNLDTDGRNAYDDWIKDTSNTVKSRDEDYYNYIENTLEVLDQSQMKWREDLFSWVGNLFGEVLNPLGQIDIMMPPPNISGLEALELLPDSVVALGQIIATVMTINEETYVEDTLKMIKLQEKLQERLSEVVR